jgi:GxxExxY protein
VDIEELVAITIDCGFHIHKEIGPGLLESAYELILADMLVSKGMKVDRQKPIDIVFQGRTLPECFRVDLLIEDRLVVELKSIERLAPVHSKQVLTYLRLMKLPLGLLMNFGGATFKEGIKRISNGHNLFAP